MAKQTQINSQEITVLKTPRELFRKKIKNRIERAKKLIGRDIFIDDDLEQLQEDFTRWNDYNVELLKRSFNKPNNEYYENYQESYSLQGIDDVFYGRDTRSFQYNVDHIKQKLQNAVNNLKLLIQKLPLIDLDPGLNTTDLKHRDFTNTCFLIHGHNNSRKFEIARYIENELKKRPIILHEQANRGRTIIEKFEDHSNVDFAVALWTADDEGRSKKETVYKDRSRQNVIFETGFFIGAIGRKNVVILYEQNVEIPSDYSGVVFIPLSGNWKHDLGKEIKAIYD